MSAAKNGGPAFPRPATFDSSDGEFLDPGDLGMSLRDWFAGQAISAALSAFIIRREGPTNNSEIEVLVGRCYDVADAMLAERAKQDGET